MRLSRRNFLKLSVPAAGTLALAGTVTRRALAGPPESLSGVRMAVLYDSSKCIGCKLCEAACRMENHQPREPEPRQLGTTIWTAVEPRQLEVKGQKREVFLKRQCLHCTDASCAAVCPTGAAAHHGEYVVIDQQWCIGCGYCQESCPFGVPHRETQGSAQKCTFCFSRVSQGSKPACVEACRTGALTYGNRADLVTAGKARVEALAKSDWPEARLYGENELGGLGVMYVLLQPPAAYGLPEKPRQATENVLAQWSSGIVTAGVLSLPFWWFFGRGKHSSEQKEAAE